MLNDTKEMQSANSGCGKFYTMDDQFSTNT